MSSRSLYLICRRRWNLLNSNSFPVEFLNNDALFDYTTVLCLKAVVAESDHPLILAINQDQILHLVISSTLTFSLTNDSPALWDGLCRVRSILSCNLISQDRRFSERMNISQFFGGSLICPPLVMLDFIRKFHFFQQP